MKITIPYLQERILIIEEKRDWPGKEKRLADLRQKLEYLQKEETR